MKHRVYLGLGSNLGDKEGNVRRAVELIDERIGEVVLRSSLLVTEPWGFESENTFVNAAICCETTLTPRQVLACTQQIERELGKTRQHATQRPDAQRSANNVQRPAYRDRPIDIDILLYDDEHIDEPGLTIPHPLMHERDFVMKPLREITDY